VEGIGEVVALLTNSNSNSNRAGEHEHRIAARVAPKNTVRRKRTGEALAAAPAQTATVPNPTVHCPHPFFVSRENGSCRTVDRFKNADFQGEHRQQLDKLSTQILLHLLRTQQLLLFTFVKEQQSSVNCASQLVVLTSNLFNFVITY
jgi:hypothetical protein